MPKDEKPQEGQKSDKPEQTVTEKIKEDKDNLEKALKKEGFMSPSPVPSDDAVKSIMMPIYFYVTGRVKVTPDSSNVIIVYR